MIRTHDLAVLKSDYDIAITQIYTQEMSSSLGDLFKQIIDSEKKAQERKDCINELKTDYAACRDVTKVYEKELKDGESELQAKTEELNCKELEKRWQTTKCNILSDERNSVVAKKDETAKKLDEVKNQLSAMRASFCRDVNVFTCGYDLCSNGYIQREHAAQEELVKVKQKQAKVIEELATYKAGEERLRELREDRGDWQKQIAVIKRKIKKIEGDNETENQTIQELVAKKQRVSKMPQTDTDFKRVQHDLEACKEETMHMESVCISLQQQLQELKQQKWQQDLQHKREQQQQQRLAYNQARAQKEAEQKTQQTAEPRNSKRFSNFKSASSLMHPNPTNQIHPHSQPQPISMHNTTASVSQPISTSDTNLIATTMTTASFSEPMKLSQTNSLHQSSSGNNSQSDDNTLEFSGDFELSDGILLAVDNLVEQEERSTAASYTVTMGSGACNISSNQNAPNIAKLTQAIRTKSAAPQQAPSTSSWQQHQQNSTAAGTQASRNARNEHEEQPPNKRFIFKSGGKTPPSSSGITQLNRNTNPTQQSGLTRMLQLNRPKTPPATSQSRMAQSNMIRQPHSGTGQLKGNQNMSEMMPNPPKRSVRFTSNSHGMNSNRGGNSNKGGSQPKFKDRRGIFTMFVRNSQEEAESYSQDSVMDSQLG